MELAISSSAAVDRNRGALSTLDGPAAHANHAVNPTAAPVVWLHSDKSFDSSHDREAAGSGKPRLGFATLGSDLPEPRATARRIACARVGATRRSAQPEGADDRRQPHHRGWRRRILAGQWKGLLRPSGPH